MNYTKTALLLNIRKLLNYIFDLKGGCRKIFRFATAPWRAGVGRTAPTSPVVSTFCEKGFFFALVKNAPPERFCLRSERLRAPLLAHSPSSLFLCAAVVNRNRSVPSVLTALACCGVCKAMRFRNALVKNAPPERFCLRSERLRAPLLAHSPSSLFLCAAVVNRNRSVPSVLTALACCGVCKAMCFRNALVFACVRSDFALLSWHTRLRVSSSALLW